MREWWNGIHDGLNLTTFINAVEVMYCGKIGAKERHRCEECAKIYNRINEDPTDNRLENLFYMFKKGA